MNQESDFIDSIQLNRMKGEESPKDVVYEGFLD